MSELTAAVERLSTSEGLVVVLDLDATVWLPEVYTLRAPRGAADDWTPTLGTDVRVLPEGKPPPSARAAPERARRRRLGVVVRAHDVVSTSVMIAA